MPLVVSEIVHETPDIVSIRMRKADGSPLPAWQPGAHVDLQLITRHERQYSLCGDPRDTASYRIAVRREELSRGGSHYIHAFLRAGSTVWVRPPRNLFELGDASAYLLLAAGIGVTPILAMARHLASIGADWRMIVAARTPDGVAFADEIAALGERASVHVSGERGRLDLATVVGDIAPGTDVYACGPAAFTDALLTLAPTLPEGSGIHLERFEPRRREFGPDEPFTATAARSGVTVEVPASRSLRETLEGAGVAVTGSCLRGVCGSCAVPVLDGAVEHRDSLTVDDDARVMYACVSRAREGSALVLDI
ncbi:Ferredoxin-NADP reductase [Microbacterium sp. ru370.1]|uniref:PDR/VanB family oxidoreductase n=1 Tax=unclassified Microbacterium TaxID=2609290 RepID=UPI00087F0CF3|nr:MULTISPECIES: PDR/VanB family oxidoreductase [unclassified Microbacterium]SDO25835.1 Ferredoxin-NADP reductase [Microbacterium sp. ru370.1]SIT73928.1 Ferredoxin-NADP reductase [Microbacterium sp. RU1D]